ncbi:alpha/beta hydrolase [Nocardioides sp. QY071]|uniref:alpha/beta hydrolase n=1 Tax=Nocardioides sp. QY071 TaxID=3044187 RepID=UPI00249B6649|nr:alpha/beta hydrolase [Nocardioides sp. QY071]WGY00905.1 alpha/beta hydrolase [Nocardioides sp. QY071]
MTLVYLPAQVPPCPQLTSTPTGAQDLATDLRAAAIAVKNVQGRAASVAAPAWEGDTAQAHDHAATQVAVRLDGAEAALDEAVTAADRFAARLSRLFVRRARINADRAEVNELIGALVAEVAAAADDSRLADFRQRADVLHRRAVALRGRIDAWVLARAEAEADLVAALQGVDSVAEGVAAAADPARPRTGDLTRQLRRLRGDPAALAAWWRGLRRAEQQALTTEHPGLVGNTGGVSMAERDEANRGELARDLDYYREREKDDQLTSKDERVLDNARSVDRALDEHAGPTDDAGAHLTKLLAYAPGLHSGDGGVAVGFGDPDTADHVSVNVPGLTTDTSSIGGNLDKTFVLHEAAVGEERGSVATVYWADYDAPSGNPLNPLDPLGQADFDGVALTDKAEAGGERFGDFVDGVRGSDQGPPAHLTAIGHSYGSTAVGHALAEGLPVDDVVLLGSPGVPADTAGELTDAQVWVGSKDHDPVSLLGSGDRGGVGALGHDPADTAFGGTRFETGEGDLRAEELLHNHTSYFTGTSLANLAHVVAGADDEVSEQPPRGAPGGGHLTLPELLVAASGASAGERLADGGRWLWEHSKFGGRL